MIFNKARGRDVEKLRHQGFGEPLRGNAREPEVGPGGSPRARVGPWRGRSPRILERFSSWLSATGRRGLGRARGALPPRSGCEACGLGAVPRGLDAATRTRLPLVRKAP